MFSIHLFGEEFFIKTDYRKKRLEYRERSIYKPTILCASDNIKKSDCAVINVNGDCYHLCYKGLWYYEIPLVKKLHKFNDRFIGLKEYLSIFGSIDIDVSYEMFGQEYQSFSYTLNTDGIDRKLLNKVISELSSIDPHKPDPHYRHSFRIGQKPPRGNRANSCLQKEFIGNNPIFEISDDDYVTIPLRRLIRPIKERHYVRRKDWHRENNWKFNSKNRKQWMK